MGTPGGLQRSVFVVDGAIPFMAEDVVLEAVLIGDVGVRLGFELSELVSVVGVGAKEGTKE